MSVRPGETIKTQHEVSEVQSTAPKKEPEEGQGGGEKAEETGIVQLEVSGCGGVNKGGGGKGMDLRYCSCICCSHCRLP